MRRISLVVLTVLAALVWGGVRVVAQTATEEWARVGMSFSGEITALAVSPNFENDRTLYIGVRSGGLWRSTEAGEPGSWCQCPSVPAGYTVNDIGLGRDYRFNSGYPCFAVTKEGYCYRSVDDFNTNTYVHSFTISGITYPLTSIVLGGVTGFNNAVYVGTYGHGVYAHYTGGNDSSWTYIGPDGGMFCNDLTITSEATQELWGAFNCTTTFGNAVLMYSAGVKWISHLDALTAQNVLTIRSSWYEPDYIWVGTEKYGMWYTSDGASTWGTACDGVTSPTSAYSVRAIRESPYSTTNDKIWEGRSDGLRTSNNMGSSCYSGYPRSKVSCIEFAPGYDISGSNFCYAFVGTDSALFRIPCAGSMRERNPRAADGEAVALGADGNGYFMGSLAGGLYKSVDAEHMVRYNAFLDSNGEPLKPQITAVCLHPAYNEQDTTCLATNANTLFVAANFPGNPSYNGVYKSVNSGNSWTKLSVGWPSSYIEVRDLAISPNYGVPSVPPVTGNDGTLVAATSQGVAKWAYDNKDGRFEWNDISPGYIESATWVALTPSYDDTTTCSGYPTYPGFPCNTVWAGGYNPADGTLRAWYTYNDDNGQWIMAGATICGGYPANCPVDVTGVAFPSNFGTGSSPSTKVFLSSSTQGIMRNAAIDWQDYWYSRNTGLPSPYNVVGIAADPDWIDPTQDSQDVLLCAVASAATASLAGVYRSDNASYSPNSWSQKLSGHAESVAFEGGTSGQHDLAMAGLKWDAKFSQCASPYGAYLSTDGGSTFAGFKGYTSLPEDVFASVVHERDPNYIFATSPSMGVFVSRDKGENFRPYNVGAGPTSGPCRLTNGYGITMLKDRRGTDLDILYVGTESGIKYRNIYYDSTALEIDLEHADSYDNPSAWRNATWASGGAATTGYWERIESVPGTASTLPVWAASPTKSSSGQGFASLPAGSYNGWILQTAGLTSTDSKGVRIGYDGASTSKRIYSGQIVSGNVPQGKWDYYYINVTYNNEDLQVFLDDPGTGSDPDLYIRYGDLPDETNYDYCPYHDGDETVCVTEIENEDFNNTWGPGGNVPPTGWTITTTESPVTWDSDNWYKYNVLTTEYAKVAGSSTRTSQNEKLISPSFNIPSDLVSCTLRFQQRYVAHSLSSSIAVKFASDQHTATLFSRTNLSVSLAYYELDLSAYAGDTHCRITFEYATSAAIGNVYYWYIENFEVYGKRSSSSPTGLKLRPGYWYIGVRGYAPSANEYNLIATLDTACTQTLWDRSLERKETLAGVKFSVPDPLAPVAGTTWGTVGLEGVVRGTGTTSFNFEERNGTTDPLINLAVQTVIQLPDLTLVVGCNPSGGNDCIWYSPSPDEGQTTWYPAHAVANESESSKNYVDLLQASNGDLLIACDDSDTALGGVWLSGDRGKNWMNISRGFDADSQNLSDLCVDSGGTPSYYASAGREDAEEADEAGLYTRSITASAYPNVTSISPTSGPDTGGTTVHVYGSGFANACPTGDPADCPETSPVVIFGENDGTTAYEAVGTYVTSAHITCISPPHQEGIVSVRVRNVDTRESFAGIGFTYTFTCKSPSGMSNNTASDVAACADSGVTVGWSAPSDWGDGGSGTRTYDVLREGSAIASGLSSVTLTYLDTTGTNGTSYTYSVRANNGCGYSTTTAGVSAADNIAPSAPAAPTLTDISACAVSGITVTWTTVTGATGYDLYIDGATTVTSVTSPYTYTPGNTNSHSIQVRAKNASCTSAWSAAGTGSDLNNTPAVPAAPTLTDISACAVSGITVTWTTVTGATGYDLYIDGATTVTSATSPYTYTPGNTNSHSIQVRAKNASCTSGWSTAGTGSDLNSTPAVPAAPTLTDISACAVSSITVTWTTVTGATGYDLYIDSTTTVTSVTSPYTYTPGNTNSHSIQVRAKNASCTSAWSTAGTGSDLNNTPAVPAAPTLTDISACAVSGITVTWTTVTGATGYDLYIDSTTTVTSATSPYTYTPGNTSSHSIQVRAKNASCTSAWSTAAAGYDVNDAPSAPSIISVADKNPAALDGVVITFTPGVPAMKHYLYVDLTLVSTDFVSGGVYIPGDSSVHSFIVKAVNGDCSEDSMPMNGQDLIVALPPEIAAGDTYETAQKWSGTFQSWPSAVEAEGYKLYRMERSELSNLMSTAAEGCFIDVGALSSHDCSADDPSGLPGRIYYYLVTGYNAAGEGTAGEGTGFTRDLSSSTPCD